MFPIFSNRLYFIIFTVFIGFSFAWDGHKILYAQNTASIDRLIGDLKSDDEAIKKETLLRLLHLEPKAKAAIPQLIEVALRDRRDEIRSLAILVINETKDPNREAFSTLNKFWNGKDQILRLRALEALANLDSKKEALGIFKRALDEKIPDMKKIAFSTLANIKEEIPLLIKRALEEEDEELESSFADSLRNLGDKTQDVILEVGNRLINDRSTRVRRNAAFILGRMGAHSINAVPKLVEASLKDADFLVRRNAAESLGYYPELKEKAIPLLLNALNNPDTMLQARAAFALTYNISIDDEAIRTKAIKQFEKLLEVPNPLVKFYAASALANWKVRSPEILKYIKQGLKSDDSQIRELAADTLGGMRKDAKEALEDLLLLLRDENRDVAEKAAESLENIRNDLDSDEEFRALLTKTIYKDKVPTVCKTLCALAENPKMWMEERSHVAPEPLLSSDWEFAISSLGALFITKASSFCDGAKEISNSIRFELTHDKNVENSSSVCPISSPFRDLKQFSNTVLDITGLPQGSYSVYGKQFYILLLKEVSKNPSLTDFERQKILVDLEKAEKSLRFDIQRSAKAISGIGGSLFNTFSLATSLLAVEEPSGIERLKEARINPNDPLALSYTFNQPWMDEGDQRKGAVARAVPVYLAFYKVEKNNDRKREYRVILKEAIRNYMENFPFLVIHLKRFSEAHWGKYDLAPYYLYPSIPYVTSAIRLLLNETQDEAERTELTRIQNDLKMWLLSLVNEQGLFESPQDMIDQYHNPLAGLALLPLAEECASKDVTGALMGILPYQ